MSTKAGDPMTGVVVDIVMGHVIHLSEKAQHEFAATLASIKGQNSSNDASKATQISNALWSVQYRDDKNAEEAQNPLARVLEFKPRSNGCRVPPRRSRTAATSSVGMTMPVA